MNAFDLYAALASFSLTMTAAGVISAGIFVATLLIVRRRSVA